MKDLIISTNNSEGTQKVNGAASKSIMVSLFKSLNSCGSKAVDFDKEIERLVRYDNDVQDKTEAYRKVLHAVGKKEADQQIVLEYTGTVLIKICQWLTPPYPTRIVVDFPKSAVADVVTEEYPIPVYKIGVNDEFGHSGPAVDLLKEFGLCADNIAAKVRKVLGK